METANTLTVDFKDVPKPVLTEIKSALEISHTKIYSDEFQPPVSSSSLTKNYIQSAWYTLTSAMVSTEWRKRSGVSQVDSLESALKLAPDKKLIGFELKGRRWPVRDLKEVGKIPEDNWVFLSEMDLQKVYVACGGEQGKAEAMFKSSK